MLFSLNKELYTMVKKDLHFLKNGIKYDNTVGFVLTYKY